MRDLPQPMVPAEVDLRDFAYMELDVQRLRDSRFAAEVDADAFRAGVLLWCASWHQVPAGSLPNSDRELATLSGYGRVVKEWLKVRDEALSLFVLCSDGRLYHREVAKKANAAWQSRLEHFYDRARDRLRKANKARAEKQQATVPEISFDDWNSARLAGGVPLERAEAFRLLPPEQQKPSAGIPPENGSKGKGNGEGDGTESYKDTDAVASGAVAPPDPADVIFALGVPMLTAASVSERNARSMLALLSKTHTDAVVADAVQRMAAAKPIQPVAWLQAALNGNGKSRGKHSGFEAKDYRTGVTQDGFIA